MFSNTRCAESVVYITLSRGSTPTTFIVRNLCLVALCWCWLRLERWSHQPHPPSVEHGNNRRQTPARQRKQRFCVCILCEWMRTSINHVRSEDLPCSSGVDRVDRIFLNTIAHAPCYTRTHRWHRYVLSACIMICFHPASHLTYMYQYWGANHQEHTIVSTCCCMAFDNSASRSWLMMTAHIVQHGKDEQIIVWLQNTVHPRGRVASRRCTARPQHKWERSIHPTCSNVHAAIHIAAAQQSTRKLGMYQFFLSSRCNRINASRWASVMAARGTRMRLQRARLVTAPTVHLVRGVVSGAVVDVPCLAGGSRQGQSGAHLGLCICMLTPVSPQGMRHDMYIRSYTYLWLQACSSLLVWFTYGGSISSVFCACTDGMNGMYASFPTTICVCIRL